MRVHKNLSQKEMFSFINLKEELLAGKGKKSEIETEFHMGLFRWNNCVGSDELHVCLHRQHCHNQWDRVSVKAREAY